jgi:hypothetical protein
MIYESARTRDIVNRLVLLGNRLQMAVVLTWVVVLTALAGILGALVWSDGWWIMALIGALVGITAGIIAAAFLMLLLEWMAQMLIAAGERFGS